MFLLIILTLCWLGILRDSVIFHQWACSLRWLQSVMKWNNLIIMINMRRMLLNCKWTDRDGPRQCWLEHFIPPAWCSSRQCLHGVSEQCLWWRTRQCCSYTDLHHTNTFHHINYSRLFTIISHCLVLLFNNTFYKTTCVSAEALALAVRPFWATCSSSNFSKNVMLYEITGVIPAHFISSRSCKKSVILF